VIKDIISFNNKKRVVVISAAAAAIMLVASIATLGATPFSIQQQQKLEHASGPRITSGNIVDGEMRNQDLADDAVTDYRIEDGEVTSEDFADGTITSTDIAAGTALALLRVLSDKCLKQV
jgi:hypothetical protein